MNCISCSMVCKIFFAPNCQVFWITLAEKRDEGEEEHRQLQSVMRFTQTQQVNIFYF